jgi:hypothetical protein
MKIWVLLPRLQRLSATCAGSTDGSVDYPRLAACLKALRASPGGIALPCLKSPAEMGTSCAPLRASCGVMVFSSTLPCSIAPRRICLRTARWRRSAPMHSGSRFVSRLLTWCHARFSFITCPRSRHLVRHPLHLALAYAGLPLYRSRITRNDAPASVWQAYTVAEMRNCFREAGAAEVSIRQQYLYRMGMIAQKPQ